MVSHEDRKKERLGIMIHQFKKGVKKDEMIAECIIEWGMSRRTVLEYIKVIEVKHGIFK